LPEKDIFNAGLGGGRHGDGVPVTSKASRNLENIEFPDGTLSSPENPGLHHIFDFSLEHARDSVPILSAQIRTGKNSGPKAERVKHHVRVHPANLSRSRSKEAADNVETISTPNP
jgi:hypothetical protein